jgi:hypothetical protein
MNTRPQAIVATLTALSAMLGWGAMHHSTPEIPTATDIPPTKCCSDSDSIWVNIPAKDGVQRLTDSDYRRAAEELGIEVAAMKAVVAVEAGASHRGFYEPGKPILNFDLAMFKRGARQRNINLTPHIHKHAEVFSHPNTARYGSYQAAQYRRLDGALAIDSVCAMENSFWGMFQIGGFNWKKCGTASVQEFVKRMSTSEHEQLELFVAFVKAQGLDKYLQKKDWQSFARIYNGPGYAKRRYHSRLAHAYAKYKKEQ